MRRRDRPRPRPPKYSSGGDWFSDPLPANVETIAERNALPLTVRRLADWVWAMDHDAMRGAGLFTHYGFLRLRLRLGHGSGDSEWVEGVTLNGWVIRRSQLT